MINRIKNEQKIFMKKLDIFFKVKKNLKKLLVITYKIDLFFNLPKFPTFITFYYLYFQLFYEFTSVAP